MNLEEFTTKLKAVKGMGNRYQAKCPAHRDHQASLSVSQGKDGRILVKCFAGCSAEEIVKALGLEMKDLFASPHVEGRGVVLPFHNKRTAAQQDITGCTLNEYAVHKGFLDLTQLQALGVTQINYCGKPAVRIGYFDRQGTEVAVRFRIALNGGRRFVWRRGDKPCLYGLWRVSEKLESITIVEGESDAQTLWLHDIPAVGLPGAGNWNEQRDAIHFAEIETIYIVIEPDKGGETVLKWLETSTIKHKVRLLHLGCKDVNEFYLKDRETFVERWCEICEKAEPFRDHEEQKQETLKQEAWTLCQRIAEQKSILDLFEKDLLRLGVAGEENIAKILYLATTSRLFDRPVSISVKGPSAGGKSYVTESVLKFFPASAYYSLSSMSEHALAYSDEPLKNRMLVIYEASGLASELASYFIRSLLSEGRVRYETVIKTNAGMECVLIEREGPTGLIVTTTAVSLHPENETRMLSLAVTDTPSQTKAIFSKIASGIHENVDLSSWQAFQSWLELGERQVLIPYANLLAELIPPIDIRLRRDFSAILSLIKAHALIHRQTRARDDTGRIVATLQDYAAVRELAEEFITENLGATVSTSIREVVEAVEALTEQDGVMLRAIAEKLQLDRSTVSRRIAKAKKAGWLKNLEDKRSRPQRLAIGDPLPEKVSILPTVEDLAVHLCKQNGGGIYLPSPQNQNRDIPAEGIPF